MPPLSLGWVRRRRDEALPSALSRVVFWHSLLFFLLSLWLTLGATPQGRSLPRPVGPGRARALEGTCLCEGADVHALIQAGGLDLALGREVSAAAAPALWPSC